MASIPQHKTSSGRLPIPVLLLIIAFATPPELSLSLGGLRLSPYRIIVLTMLIPCIGKLLCGRSGRARACDFLMLGHGLWVILALIAYAGVGQGIESGGIYFAEALGGYLIGRCCIRDSDRFFAMAKLMRRMVFLLMVVAIAESVTGNHFIRDASRAALGGPSLPYIEPRLGLHRAFTSFDHPILYGIFCASTMGMAVYLTDRKSGMVGRIRQPLVTVTATFFSLSSGAFSALGAQLMLVAWDVVTRRVTNRWWILGSLFAAVWGVITLLSNRGPVKVFLSYFTFSPGTGYNRLRIWEYGSAEVVRHPLLGIGLGEWDRPTWMVSNSMDNFWLATAVRYGIPAFGFLALVVLYIAFRQLTSKDRTLRFHQCRCAWIISISGMSLAACTVHFWNSLFCLFCLLIGSGVWMTDRSRQASRSI
ncbi:MAG: O-antigen ligase family protein [Planctomycetota bacterium]